ncbi:MAG: hypothetical protein LBL94_07040 [Prevotellaceae bacterium]|nr:hypothetical protein [Prevotellaceae bacterium]
MKIFSLIDAIRAAARRIRMPVRRMLKHTDSAERRVAVPHITQRRYAALGWGDTR